MNDRPSFRLASALIFGGELLFIGAGMFHPATVAANQHPEVFAEYANSAFWGAVHMGQFAGMAALLAGLVTLVFAIGGKAGFPIGVGGLAAISAIVTIALTAVLQAVDGVALKAAADAWFGAPAAEQAARLAAVEAVSWLEWGVRSYQRAVLGVTLILVAAQIVISARVPAADRLRDGPGRTCVHRAERRGRCRRILIQWNRAWLAGLCLRLRVDNLARDRGPAAAQCRETPGDGSNRGVLTPLRDRQQTRSAQRVSRVASRAMSQLAVADAMCCSC